MIKVTNNIARKYLSKPCRFKIRSTYTDKEFVYVTVRDKYPDCFRVYVIYDCRLPTYKGSTYIGTFYAHDNYFCVSKHEVVGGHLSERARAVNIVFKNIHRLEELSWLEIFVEIKCKLCRRELKDTVSLMRGYGPECYKKIMEKQNVKFKL